MSRVSEFLTGVLGGLLFAAAVFALPWCFVVVAWALEGGQ